MKGKTVRTCFALSGIVVLLTTLSARAENPSTVQKKFVLFGFEMGRCNANGGAKAVLETAPLFREAGLDGIGLYLPGKTFSDGRKRDWPMNDPFVWKDEDLAGEAAGYREAFRRSGLDRNFLKTFFSAPKKHIDWDDDAAWARVAENLRVVARFAKKAGFRGLCADHEDYHHSSQFTRRLEEPAWDDLVPVVRARGRQVFSAVFSEAGFPDAEIFFFWFLGWRDRFFTCRDVEGALRDNGELWPAFANGILDALPPTARIVDADEWAYYHEETEYFARSHNFRTVACQGMVAPENRVKYRNQVSMGFGLYTDMYTLPEKTAKGVTPAFYRGPDVDGSRLRKFSRILGAAADASDEYVWFWNEQIQWVKWRPTPKKYGYANTCIDEYLPGIHAVCNAARGAEDFIEKRECELAAKGLLTNLVANATCEPDDKSLAPGQYLDHKGTSVKKTWFSWHAAVASNGVAGVDIGGGYGGGSALMAKGSREGCFTYPIKNARPGDYYGIRVRAKGPAEVTVYPRKDGKRPKWYDEMGKIYCVPFGKPDARGWKQARAVLRIPDGVDLMDVHFGWRQKPDEATWFDDIVIEPLVWYDPSTERTRSVP